jgi:tRNA modification GTPase
LAIVTPIAGTTRDVVQQTIQIEGVPVHIIDTAGLREGEGIDDVEKIGIQRAWEQIAAADAVLFLHDLTRQHLPDYVQADAQIQATLSQQVPQGVSLLHVWNKCDIANQSHAARLGGDASTAIDLSAKTGQGIDQLRSKLLEAAGWQPVAEGLYLARARHVQALQRVQSHLEWADMHLRAQAQSLDLLAEELRLSQSALNEITGEFSADDLLGVIFSSFCIGK